MDKIKPIDLWIRNIVDRELPAMGFTVKTICELLAKRISTANDIANTILKDPGMTSTLLRVANSAYYNTGGSEITTVSRAVVLLGSQAIRNLSLSVSVMENVIKGAKKDRQLQLLAKSMFAATQAKSLAIKRNHPHPEEVFIATLLYHLGEMTFWCVDSREALALDKALSNPRIPRAVAEKEILGFRFAQLTHALSYEWNLGDALREALIFSDGRNGEADARNIVLSHQIENASRNGIESPIMNWVCKRTSDFIQKPVDEVKTIVTTTAETAQETADEMGVDLKWRVKPEKDLIKVSREYNDRASSVSRDVQNQISSEIDKMIPSKPDVQLILRMIIEGIQRGGNMDRTLLAILTPDRNKLIVKYQLGDESSVFCKKFDFPLENNSMRLFPFIMRQIKRPVWISKNNAGGIDKMITTEIRNLTEGNDFLVAPLIIDDKDIGMIYSDRGISKSQMDREAFENFCRFAQQANTCLHRIHESPLKPYLTS